MKKILFHKLFLFLTIIVVCFVSCDNVDEGIDIDYDESSADFNVELLSNDRGTVGDTISYTVTVSANGNIKSLFVNSSISGSDGTAFNVDDDDDPFIDHTFGTIQSGVSQINLTYKYIVSQDTVDVDLVFTMVDETGIKRDTQIVVTVLPITTYSDIVMYAQSKLNADGFATSDGTVYHNLSDYEEVTTVNQAIQESLDLVFVISDDNAVLAAPYDGYFTSGMNVKNKTLFKEIDDLNSDDFDDLTSAELSSIVEDNEVKKGSTSIAGITVGDIIGFRTDYSSANSYNYGILRVNAIHPTVVDYYDGMCYVLEMDVKVQLED